MSVCLKMSYSDQLKQDLNGFCSVVVLSGIQWCEMALNGIFSVSLNHHMN